MSYSQKRAVGDHGASEIVVLRTILKEWDVSDLKCGRKKSP